MKRLIVMLVLLAIGINLVQAQNPQPGADGTGDPLFPQAGNGGYDVQHYALDLSWDAEENILSGTAIIDARATQDLSAFNLDFIGFEISELMLDGDPADYSRDAQELTITPDGFLPDGDEFSVSIAYSGVPERLTDPSIPVPFYGWLHFARENRATEQIINTVFIAPGPFAAATWYPNNDNPFDEATYSLRMTAPHSLRVGASGVLVETVEADDATTFVWETSTPTGGFSLVIGVFETETLTGAGGLPIYTYLLPDGARQTLAGQQQSAGETVEIIAFFEQIFGPYPLESLGIAVVNGASGAAFAQHGMTVFLGAGLDPEVLGHEIAHQWFGGSLSSATSPENWLNEAFATYAELLWAEERGGDSGVSLDFRMRVLYNRVRALPPPAKPPEDDLLNPGVYLRGAWTLHALRARVGDEAFFDILRAYNERFRHSVVSTNDFIAVSEEVSGQDLSDLFQGWLFDPVAPPVPELGLGVED